VDLLGDRLADLVLVEIPLPEADAIVGPFVFVREIVADALPLLFGANLTVMVTLCPAESVNGRLKPLRVNSGFVVVAAGM
jgi:hypothetical protein